jgi:hypothetical protein
MTIRIFQMLIAFLFVMIILSICAVIGEILQIDWLIRYAKAGFLIGNIIGALLGIYNTITPIIRRALFKDLGITLYVLVAVGIFTFLINFFEVIEFFGYNNPLFALH